MPRRVPLSSRITNMPAWHRVAVTKPGRAELVRDLRLDRGHEMVLDAPLSLTSQRKMAYVLFGTGAAATVAGALLTAFAFEAQGEAAAIRERMRAGDVVCKESTCPDLARYDSALDRRGTPRGAAIAAGAGAGLSALIGVSLFFLDTPVIPVGGIPGDAKEPAKPRRAPVELSLVPSPGGLSLIGRF
jgi:hypothetical protein